MNEQLPLPNRLASLDLLKGMTMILLALESTMLFEHLLPAVNDGWATTLLTQFFHHPWNGLRFWDLIQPNFMFIAGVALAFSMKKQRRILTWNQAFVKILKRCGWLFFWGVLDYAVRGDRLSFELWDVLTQLSFTTHAGFFDYGMAPAIATHRQCSLSDHSGVAVPVYPHSGF